MVVGGVEGMYAVTVVVVLGGEHLAFSGGHLAFSGGWVLGLEGYMVEDRVMPRMSVKLLNGTGWGRRSRVQ